MYLLQQFNRGKLLAIAFSVVITGTISAGPGNYNQQGPKLVGSGVVGKALPTQGYSISISADGNTALSGGVGDNNFGAVWVFTRSNEEWTQQGPKLVGTGAVFTANSAIGQGWSVALSADGNTAAVGANGDNGGRGAVWVFTRSGGIWTQQGDKLAGTPIDSAGEQGQAVGLSADGNTLADGSAEAAFIFTRTGGVWTQQARIGGVLSIFQGLALSADGNTLARGVTGGVQIYTRSNGIWTPQGNELTIAPSTYNGSGRNSFNLTGDGNTLLFNGWFFYRENGVWTQRGSQLVGSAGGQLYPVAISADGSTVAAGDCGTQQEFACEDNGNTVAVFTPAGGAWSLHQECFGSGAVGTAVQGTRIVLSANGNTMMESGYGDNRGFGAAWVFATPQLSTSLTHTGHFTQGETGASYAITVTNAGDRDIHTAPTSPIIVVDKLPTSLTPTAIFGSGWTCTLATVSCTRDDGLPVGESLPSITVLVNVASNAPSSVINAATASGGGSNWGNATDVTTIAPKP